MGGDGYCKALQEAQSAYDVPLEKMSNIFKAHWPSERTELLKYGEFMTCLAEVKNQNATSA